MFADTQYMDNQQVNPHGNPGVISPVDLNASVEPNALVEPGAPVDLTAPVDPHIDQSAPVDLNAPVDPLVNALVDPHVDPGVNIPLNQNLQCDVCKTTFRRLDNLQRHIDRGCDATTSCRGCHKTFAIRNSRLRHERLCASYKKYKRQSIAGGGAGTRFRSDPPRPQQDIINQYPEYMRPIVRENYGAIRAYHERFTLNSVFNLRQSFDEQLTNIFMDTPSMFRISVSPGYLLREQDLDELRYYHASNDNALIKVNGQYATQIASQNDFNRFLRHFNNIDLLDHARLQRPSTRYSVERVLNVNVFITYLESIPIGKVCTDSGSDSGSESGDSGSDSESDDSE